MRLKLAFALLLAFPVALAHAGVIQGSVRLPSTPGERATFQPYAGRASSLPSAAHEARGRVTDAVLSVESVPAEVDRQLPAPSRRHQLSQKDQSFVPRVLAIPTGTAVDFPNLDPIYHNVFSVSPARRFDLGKYPRGDSRTVTFTKPGLVNVYCDIHSDMAAFILVLPNRAFSRPAEDGTYHLPDLPPGRYVVRWWHPDFDGSHREVVVPEHGDVTLDVSF